MQYQKEEILSSALRAGVFRGKRVDLNQRTNRDAGPLTEPQMKPKLQLMYQNYNIYCGHQQMLLNNFKAKH